MRLFLLTLFFTSLVFCGELPDSIQASAIMVHAVRLQEQLKIDGVLSESVWQNQSTAPELTQREPTQGVPPSERTVVRIAYDDGAIYIGAHLYDSHPDSIITRLGRRDSPTNSDRFVFFIDPYFDRRSGFFF